MFNDWFLLVAFNLSVLTYYFGVLIYSLPIPWYGLKKWGPILVVDGITSAILIFGFNIIVQAVNYVFTVLDLSWDNLIAWLNTVISSIFALIFFIQLLGNLLLRLSMGLLPNFFGPMYSILSYSLTSLFLIEFITIIVRLYFAKLMALGVMLYAVPFRIARTAGAVLIAFSIVFYIGLPLLPSFIQTFTQTQELGIKTYTYGISFPQYSIKSYNGSSIPYAILHLYSINNTVLAMYIANDNGIVYASYPDRGSPSNYFKVEVEYFGYIYNTDPHIFINNFTCTQVLNENENTTCSINIHVPGILYATEYMVLFNVWNASVNNFSVSSNKINIILNSSKKGIYELMVWKGITNSIRVFINDSLVINDSIIIDNIKWYDNDLHVLKIKLNHGLWNVSILLEGTYESIKLDSEVIETYYIRDTMNSSNILDLVGEASSYYLFSSIILPSSYMILLTIISYGFAIFLGGRYPRIPIRVL